MYLKAYRDDLSHYIKQDEIRYITVNYEPDYTKTEQGYTYTLTNEELNSPHHIEVIIKTSSEIFTLIGYDFDYVGFNQVVDML